MAPGKQEPILCKALRVWEEEPPEGIDALEWILLTDQELATFEEALECCLQYATRWLIEEFHKALKSGLHVEKLQLETASRLFAAIAIMSVVALRMVALRELAHLQEDLPSSESGLNDLELKLLQSKLGKHLETVRDVWLAIGRLGGHMNRKKDGLPGWQTLWRGMTQLLTLAEGVRLALGFKENPSLGTLQFPLPFFQNSRSSYGVA